jgi:EmrB/QacA subfamily drug resistance transporter
VADALAKLPQSLFEPCSRGVIAAEPCPRTQKREIPASHRSIVLTACVLASAMAFVDGSALTVALPRLRAAVGADLASVQWIVTGYMLALASFTLIGGALADAHGKARILALGCLIFAAASIACALAPSVAWLIVWRVVQGIGAALLTPSSLALIGATYPQSERNRAIGIWAAASALTTAAGPVLGGWLTETFGWQAVFWINPPLAIGAVALLWRYAPPDARVPRRFDLIGALIVAAALGALAWSLSKVGNASGGSSEPVVVIAGLIGVAGLALYAMWERRTDHPMTPPRLAKNRIFVGINIATLFIYAGLAIMFFLLPFDLLDRRGLTPTQAGVVFLPFTFGVGLLARPFGTLADMIGATTMLIAGPLGAALAYVWLALAQDRSLLSGVIGPMALLGVSFALLVAPLTASVLSSVTQADGGLASGVNNAASRVAQLSGAALAAGLGSLASGYQFGLIGAAALSIAGAATVVATTLETRGK